MKILFQLAIFLVLFSCGSRSAEDYREEGQKVIQKLVDELSKIESKADLLHSSGTLKSLFMKLTDIMIAARDHHENDSYAEPLPFSAKDKELSERFRTELNRIYEMDGCKEVIEKCQEEALNKLDAFEKNLAFKRESFIG